MVYFAKKIFKCEKLRQQTPSDGKSSHGFRKSRHTETRSTSAQDITLNQVLGTGVIDNNQLWPHLSFVTTICVNEWASDDSFNAR